MTLRIGRLFPVLMWLIGLLFGVLVVGPAGNYMFELYRRPPPAAVTTARDNWQWILVALAGVLGLAVWSYRARRVTEGLLAFAALKPATRLSPQDLGFATLSRNEGPTVTERPFTSHHISRTMYLDSETGTASSRRLDEERLAQRLREGQSFVLLGQPSDGKTRTVYEVVRRLTGFDLLIPRKDQPVPPDDAFDIVKGRRVVLVLDDLTSYVGAPLDLALFSKKLDRAESWVVAATCRDGPELRAVSESYTFGLRRFYEDIPLKLRHQPITDTEKAQLATSVGRPWDPTTAALFPTPGSIVMAEPLSAMRHRFDLLRPELRDTVLALALLTQAGVLPFTHRRLEGVLAHVFHRQTRLSDCLQELADQAFIEHPAQQDPVQPRPAYLRPPVVTYEAHRSLRQDFAALQDMLVTADDAGGLFLLGTTELTKSPPDFQRGLECLDAALGIRPDFPAALNNKGNALISLGEYAAALEVFDAAIALQPNDPATLNGKGVALTSLGEYSAALSAFDVALRIRPEFAEAFNNKGVALDALGRHAEAVSAFDAAIALRPNDPESLHNKGNALLSLGQYARAVVAFDAALALRPNDPDALNNKGIALDTLGEYAEAVKAYDRAIALKPENASMYRNRAHSLVRIDQLGRAEADVAAAERLDPLHPYTVARRAQLQYAKGDYDGALAFFDRAAERVADKSEFNFDRALPLLRQGRVDEALAAIRERLEVYERPSDVHVALADFQLLRERDPTLPGLDDAIALLQRSAQATP